MGERRKQRTYSVQERQDAVERAKELGNAAASRELGIPSGTLSCWSFQARQAEKKGEPWPKAAELPATAPLGAEAGGGRQPVPTALSQVIEEAQVEAPPRCGAASSSYEQPPSNGTEAHDAAKTVAPVAEPAVQARQTRRVARRYTPSERANALETAAREGVLPASRKLGMSPWSINQWRHKAKRAARGEGSSPTSGPDPAVVEEQRDREILTEWKEHPGLGPSQIHNQLRRRGIKVCTNTVRRVMEDAGYRPPKEDGT